MKLVEILAREMVEWPAGVPLMWQSEYDLEVYAGLGSFYPSMAAEDRGQHNKVTRAMWEAERAKMEGKTEWSGEGCPKAGELVDAPVNGYRYMCEVMAVEGDEVAVRMPGAMRVVDISAIKPVRTQEQIAAQEREQAITELMQTTCIRRGEAARIYDAGYRRQ